MSAAIFGRVVIIWTSTGDNFKDISSKINTGTIKIEDNITISMPRFVPQTKQINLSVVSNPYVVDSAVIRSFNNKNLTSWITGINLSSVGNLRSIITATSNISYNSTPDVEPQLVGRETVINIDRYEGPYWEREILLAFSESSF